MNARPAVSVVIPLKDEAGTLVDLCDQIEAALSSTDLEIVLVDDGSTDGSSEICAELAASRAHVRVIRFRRNFGKAAALDAGFEHARGALVVTLDADLQDEPREIPRLLAKLDDGFDVVSGWKKDRKDPIGKTAPSKVFNAVVRWFSGVPIHDFNCGFKAYRAEALENLTLYGELHRYIPVLLHARGFRVTELAVEHHPRRAGKSKYGLERLHRGLFDLLTVLLLTRYRTRPLHLFGGTGLVLAAVGFLILSYLTVLWFIGLGPIGSRPLFFLGILLMVIGVQLVSTGLLAEMLAELRAQQVPLAYRRLSDPVLPQTPSKVEQHTESQAGRDD